MVQTVRNTRRRHRRALRVITVCYLGVVGWVTLGPQPLDGVTVNARQQSALAPFLGLCSRREAPAHGEAFGFERRQRGGGLGRRKPK